MEPTAEDSRHLLNALRYWKVLDALDQRSFPKIRSDEDEGTINDTVFSPKTFNIVDFIEAVRPQGKKDGKTSDAPSKTGDFYAQIYLGAVSREEVAGIYRDQLGRLARPRPSEENPHDRQKNVPLLAFFVTVKNPDSRDASLWPMEEPELSPLVWLAYKLRESERTEEGYAQVDFEKMKEECQALGNQFASIVFSRKRKAEASVSLDASALNEDNLRALFAALNNLTGLKVEKRICVRRISKKYSKGLINQNFFVRDLQHLEGIANDLYSHGSDVLNDRFGNLISYARQLWRETPREEPIDLLRSSDLDRKDIIRRLMSPKAMPLGLWPAAYYPSFMQQVAINATWESLFGGQETSMVPDGQCVPAVMSVNGPPGTGKTTLLKNIAAGLTVEKAARISGLFGDWNSIYTLSAEQFTAIFDSAFRRRTATVTNWDKSKKETRDYYVFADDSFNDLGILLCSANNTALKNVTSDWSERRTICSDLGIEATDNRGIASLLFPSQTSAFDRCLLGLDDPEDNDSEPDLFFSHASGGEKAEDSHWALMGAPLGNGDNRRAFFKETEAIGSLVAELCCEDGMRAVTQTNAAKLRQSIEAFLSCKKDVLELIGHQPNSISDALLDDLSKDSSSRDAYAEAHSGNPLHDEKLDRNRQRLFLLSLRVVMYFFLCAPPLQENLRLLYEHEKTNKPKFLYPEEMMCSLYQTLLLLVPVVSSTFHSVGNMFGGDWKANALPENEGADAIAKKAPFGLLIVDEAGQALPHTAAGAIFRCRHALIVGDPMQIKPIKGPGVDELAPLFSRHYGLENTSLDASVQAYADAQNPLGSNVGDTWTGCPLVVHRRCLDPMFAISNDLSYAGAMVNKTIAPDPEKTTHYLGKESTWLNVGGALKGSEEQGKGALREKHCVPDQTDVVVKLIRRHLKLREQRASESRLYVVSPFKSIAEDITNAIDQLRKEEVPDKKALAPYSSEYKKADRFIGTVHTFQGKEAEEVIFVLGCGTESLGSANWVEADSSIINVAVSRAKHHLYVVGDISVWSRTKNKTVEKFLYERLSKNPATFDRSDLIDKRYLGPFGSSEELNHHFERCEAARTDFLCAMVALDECKGDEKPSHDEAPITEARRIGRPKECIMHFSSCAEAYLNAYYFEAFKCALPDANSGRGKTMSKAKADLSAGNYGKLLEGTKIKKMVQLCKEASGQTPSAWNEDWWRAFRKSTGAGSKDHDTLKGYRDRSAHPKSSEDPLTFADCQKLYALICENYRSQGDRDLGKSIFMDEELPRLLNGYVSAKETEPKPQPSKEQVGSSATKPELTTLTKFLEAAGEDYSYTPASVNLFLESRHLIEKIEPKGWKLGPKLRELGCVEEWKEGYESPTLRYSPEGVQYVLRLIRLHPDDLSPRRTKKK